MENKRVPEVRFEGFSEEWEKSRLSDIVKLFGGNAFSSSDSSSFGIPWLKIANVGINGIDWSASDYLPNEFWIIHKDYRLHKGDYVMALTRPILNHNLKISILDKEALLNQRVAKLNFETIAGYGYQILKRRSVVDRIENELAGSDPPNLGSGNLKNIDISITFNKDEQFKIGTFFKQLDDTIALQQRQLERLKDSKQGFLQKMFPKDGMRVPEVRFAGFTEVWKQYKLNEVTESFEYGLNARAKAFDGENKYIRITDIDSQSNMFSQTGLTSPDINLESADSYKLKDGDILFARTGASVGKTYCYDESDGKVYYAGFLIRARINNQYDHRFIFQNTLTNQYDKFVRVTSQRSGQPGINAKEFAGYSIMIPLKEEQQKIGEFFKQIDDTIALHEKELDLLKETKKAFLQKMFV